MTPPSSYFFRLAAFFFGAARFVAAFRRVDFFAAFFALFFAAFLRAAITPPVMME